MFRQNCVLNQPLADKLVLQPGLNYHTFSADGGSTSSLSVPVLFKYNVAEKINILAGPSLYYSLESEVEDKTVFGLDLGGSYDITDNFSSTKTVIPNYNLSEETVNKVEEISELLWYNKAEVKKLLLIPMEY